VCGIRRTDAVPSPSARERFRRKEAAIQRNESCSGEFGDTFIENRSKGLP
jgi:hypothetical protein